MSTVQEALQDGSAHLAASGVDRAEWDAERLLRHILDWDRATLLAHARDTIEPAQEERYRALLAARARRLPLQHILGRQAFWRHELGVTRDVLIPRPETEVLVEVALKRVARLHAPVLADVGTGSGNIALALAHERPDALIHAVDISPDALEVARENAARHRLDERVRFHRGDLLDPLASLRGAIDLVASNPPYVALRDASSLEPEVRLHEPAVALFAPAGDPLFIYRRLAPEAFAALRPGGWLVVEVGDGMAQAVGSLFHQGGFELLPPTRDLAGVERVVTGRRPG